MNEIDLNELQEQVGHGAVHPDHMLALINTARASIQLAEQAAHMPTGRANAVNISISTETWQAFAESLDCYTKEV